MRIFHNNFSVILVINIIIFYIFSLSFFLRIFFFSYLLFQDLRICIPATSRDHKSNNIITALHYVALLTQHSSGTHLAHNSSEKWRQFVGIM